MLIIKVNRKVNLQIFVLKINDIKSVLEGGPGVNFIFLSQEAADVSLSGRTWTTKSKEILLLFFYLLQGCFSLMRQVVFSFIPQLLILDLLCAGSDEAVRGVQCTKQDKDPVSKMFS